MAGEYKFNPGEYEQVFARMFGGNAWKEGMAEASLLGRTNAEVDFAKQLYLSRLKAAEEAASRRSSSSSKKESGGGGDSKAVSSGNKLLNEFRAEKRQAQLSPLEVYNNETKMAMGGSLARNTKTPSLAENPNLLDYDKMRITEADAVWHSKNRRR